VGHAWAYCAAIETLAECELGLDVDMGRAVALELERVGMHLAGLSGLSADIGLLQGATTYGRLRTTAINTMMRLGGSRFGRGALRPGGVRLRLSPELAREVAANIGLLQRDLAPINELFLSARTVQHRLRGVGTLTAAQASELGVVGLAARASGLPIDMRRLTRAGAYQWRLIEPVVQPDGDCWSRAKVRIEELDASLAWIAATLEYCADGQRPLRALGEIAPDRLAIAVVEGFRGEIVHCLETGAKGELRHYKVQDPSFRNWMGLALAMRGNEISDFPICNKSFDLSYAGHDL
jgi:Ni,Fe-hydrogenase III large subunit